jgi:hypothetical protein
MRAKLPEAVERGRIITGEWRSRASDGANGAFTFWGPKGGWLRVIASDGLDPAGGGWEHVSVSVNNRCPNWPEMCWIKDLFWDEEETVIQFHPPKSEYVNYHPFTLHLWRRRTNPVGAPPSILVGPKP